MFIQPNWPAPQQIKAYTTLRSGGVSQSPFDQFNLAEHVGDNPENVSANREILQKNLHLPADPIWINQTHSIITIPALPENKGKEADASYSDKNNHVCAVLTADCLPILLCNQAGTHVAAIHGGWRGLAHGIIAATIKALQFPAGEVLAWLGPAISAANYEVGDEVRDQFISLDPESIYAFTPSPRQRWQANLYAIAKLQLLRAGVTSIYGGEFCTFADPKRFYSYRRDGSQTGRMASLIWISDSSVE